jgi:hypothetical protein
MHGLATQINIYISNLHLALSGTASSQDPTGSLSFSLNALESGLYNQALPSRVTRFLQGNRFGIGKQSVTKRTWTSWLRFEDATASLAAESCRWSRATSLDQPATRVQGSFTATTSKRAPLGTLGSGSDGQEGISVSSSSSIHSGYSVCQVTLSLACSSLTVEITWLSAGSNCVQEPYSVLLKFKSPTLR